MDEGAEDDKWESGVDESGVDEGGVDEGGVDEGGVDEGGADDDDEDDEDDEGDNEGTASSLSVSGVGAGVSLLPGARPLVFFWALALPPFFFGGIRRIVEPMAPASLVPE